MTTQTRWFAIPARRNGVGPLSAMDVDRMFGASRPPTSLAPATSWRPALELVEFDDRYLLTLEVPGFSIHDVDVEVEDGVVRVTGARQAQEPTEENGRRLLVSERAFGAFERTLQLPTPVLEAKARATLKDGLLVVELPKQEKPRAKKLTIQAAD